MAAIVFCGFIGALVFSNGKRPGKGGGDEDAFIGLIVFSSLAFGVAVIAHQVGLT